MQYTDLMPVDVAAEVIANTRLSPDYNILALSAPAIARGATPGQFVMLKAAPGHDPMLRQWDRARRPYRQRCRYHR